MTVLPSSLYGQHTSSHFPTRRVSKGGASRSCRTSTLSEMPAASRSSRAAFAFSRRFETLKMLCCSRRSTSASAVPRVLIERTRS